MKRIDTSQTHAISKADLQAFCTEVFKKRRELVSNLKATKQVRVPWDRVSYRSCLGIWLSDLLHVFQVHCSVRLHFSGHLVVGFAAGCRRVMVWSRKYIVQQESRLRCPSQYSIWPVYCETQETRVFSCSQLDTISVGLVSDEYYQLKSLRIFNWIYLAKTLLIIEFHLEQNLLLMYIQRCLFVMFTVTIPHLQVGGNINTWVRWIPKCTHRIMQNIETKGSFEHPRTHVDMMVQRCGICPYCECAGGGRIVGVSVGVHRPYSGPDAGARRLWHRLWALCRCTLCLSEVVSKTCT